MRTTRESSLYYLRSRYYSPVIGRFISADGVIGANSDFAAYNVFTYCGNNPVCRIDTLGTAWVDVISGIIHAGNSFAISIGFDTAAIGAIFLNMWKDGSGVYHASFDCWQQYFGYNELYDYAFDVGTSMVSAIYDFSYGGSMYTIWAWKGDYINLGAGAELGIYCGGSGHRTVDKGLAMKMSMSVSYQGNCIIDYNPSSKQWWVTGFNPKYQNVSANDLSAWYGLYFDDPKMYQAFKNRWGADSSWTFHDKLNLAILNL